MRARTPWIAAAAAAATFSLSFTAGAAAADSASLPAVSPSTRVAALGQLLGPRAAADARALLGAVTGPGPASASADADAGLDGNESPTPAGTPQAGRDPGSVAGTDGIVTGSRALDTAVAPHVGRGVLPQPAGGSQTDLSDPIGTVGTSGAAPAGTLTCPVAGPNSFSDTFGVNRGEGRIHQGTDMMATQGLPVVAVADATVVRIHTATDQDGLGGITASYTTGNGDRWYNAHLSALVSGLHVGLKIKAGQTLGYVGKTGDARTTPPHLHIERHPGGADQAVDAYPDLRRACG